MIYIDEFIQDFPKQLVKLNARPWLINAALPEMLPAMIMGLGGDYIMRDNSAIHKTATIETGAVIKGCCIIGPNCFIASGAYLRGGVYLGDAVVIGPGTEVKTSIIMHHSHLAHFNFIGDSLIGSHVNLEAGAVVCNHWNERTLKAIRLRYRSEIIETEVEKFGAVVGDQSRIGANAVLSPGTILSRNSVVGRLQLVVQLPEDRDM